jgi:hypothetical protein
MLVTRDITCHLMDQVAAAVIVNLSFFTHMRPMMLHHLIETCSTTRINSYIV